MPQKIRLALTSFRWRVTLWFSALVLLMLASAGFYVGRMELNQLSILSGETLSASAKSAADLLSLGLRERQKDIQLLSMVSYLKTSDLSAEDIRDLLELRKQTYNEYAWLGIANAKGVIVQATNGVLIGTNARHRNWFKTAMMGFDANSMHTIELQTPGGDEGQKFKFVGFSTPIFDDRNQVRGVLASHVMWDWVTDTVASAIPEDARARGVEILIADKHGEILYPLEFIGETRLNLDWPDDERYQMMRWDNGEDFVVSQANVRMKLDGDNEWRIIVRQASHYAFAPAYELLNRLLLLGLGAALFFIVAAHYAALRISRPIETLAEAARCIEKRDKEPQFPRDNHILEIKVLSDSVQAMTASLLNNKQELETLNASLEKQVEDRTRDLLSANQALEKLATTDGLTQINNRRSFDERLREHFLLTKRGKENFSLLIIDIDFFKKVNDVHGHQIGDHVLQKLAQMLKENTRGTDFVARYGGEEFVILLSNTEDEREACTLAEKIRRSVEATPFPVVGSLTISIGVSCSRKDDQSEETILKRADQALYTAKESGRNRVEFLLIGGDDLDSAPSAAQDKNA